MSLEVLGLLKDFLEDFIFGVRRVAVVGEDKDKVHLEFGLPVGTGRPIYIPGFVIDYFLDSFG